MTVKNTRQKGRKVVKYAIPILRDYDPTAYECVGSGQGTHDKGDVRLPQFKTTLEFKNVQQISVESWIHEIEKDARMQGDTHGIVVWRCPKSPENSPHFHAAIDFWALMELLKESRGDKTVEPSRELRWALENIKQSANKVLKLIK